VGSSTSSADECYFCDETECLESHHVVPQRFDGSDREVNLVTVCPTCHRKLEKLYDKRFYTQVGARRQDGHIDCEECPYCGEEFVNHELYRQHVRGCFG
jgi:uncharacterized protein with PIN domain